MRRSFSAWLGACCLGMMSGACADGVVTRGDPIYGGSNSQGGSGNAANAGGSGAVPEGHGVGENCSGSDPCRAGLSCVDGECQAAGDKAVGAACVVGDECQSGQCVQSKCASGGTGTEGTSCKTDAECAAGLRCALAGLGLSCTPEGEGDVGASCAASTDCLAGLSCVKEQCAVSAGSLPGTTWAGVSCEKPVKSGVKAFFEVPGAAGAEEGDFFRLPFPTDVRRRNERLDLSGFPTPGPGLLGVDAVQLYVDAITENDSGWGAYPTVLFRFSGGFDYASFAPQGVQFFDVTDPSKARKLGWQRFFTSARTNYVCDNFVAVQPPRGAPLEPGHTYAVFLLSEAPDEQGEPVTLIGSGDQQPVVASDNFVAVMGDEVPSDAKLKAAHQALAPLRELLAEYSGDEQRYLVPDNLLSATVFTVEDVRAPMAELANAVAGAEAPSASGWVKCGGKAVSPCPQAEGDRACGDDVDGYDEYHALLSMPVFQQGTPPYSQPSDGGSIDTKKPHFEDVCLSITVPEGAPPAAGWPAVVFAHGTGGSFRSHVRDEVAGVLAAADPPLAVIGIDQVEHGPRRGASQDSPDNLFFNFLNPAASRGNPLQGAADQLTLARFVKDLDVDAKTSTGSAIKIDGSQLLFFGHSQGSTEGSLMLPFADEYRAAVLSGNGASLREALYTKTKPQNIAAALPFVLQEDPRVSSPDFLAVHPVLSLLQHWIDPADPLNFAAVIGEPLEGHVGKHVFQTFGIEDSYSPPETLETFTLAAGLTQVAADASADPPYVGSLPQKSIASPGYQAAAGGVTLGMRQYGAPSGSDGHFVVFDNEAANRDMVSFLTGALGSEPPKIGH